MGMGFLFGAMTSSEAGSTNDCHNSENRLNGTECSLEPGNFVFKEAEVSRSKLSLRGAGISNQHTACRLPLSVF